MGTSLFGLKPKNTYQALLKTTANTAIDATLRTISDGLGNDTPLQLSLTDTQINSTLRVHTNNAELLDLEDVSSNNRFNINRDVQKINLDFASNPGGSTTQVGAIRTYQDGVNLSDSMSFFRDGNIGIGTTTDAGFKLDVNGTARMQATVGTATYVAQIINPTNSGAQYCLNLTAGNNDNNRILHCQNIAAQSIFVVKGNRSININPPSATDNLATLFVGNGIGGFPTLFVKGGGATAATKSLLVQNSAGTQMGYIDDLGQWQIGSGTNGGFKLDVAGTMQVQQNLTLFSNVRDNRGNNFITQSLDTVAANRVLTIGNATYANINFSTNPSVLIGTTTLIDSSKLTVDSTFQGFLPPRMTTVQKNAIVTPAAGLIVYDNTLNKLCVRTAAAWETITSI